jgi:hypothetical protein
MDVSQLIRNDEVVLSAFKTVGDTLIAIKPCKIHVPVHYEESGLIEIGAENNLLGIFPIIVEDTHYAVNTTLAMMRMEPTAVSTITIKDTQYYEFYFEPGAVFLANMNLVVNDVIAYEVYNEFIAKVRIPWCFTYQDLGTLFINSGKYTGMKVGATKTIIEMIVAAIARQDGELANFYRHLMNALDGKATQEPVYIPVGDVIYGATNTTAKMIGAYFTYGTMSALVNPSIRNEKLEDILRR